MMRAAAPGLLFSVAIACGSGDGGDVAGGVSEFADGGNSGNGTAGSGNGASASGGGVGLAAAGGESNNGGGNSTGGSEEVTCFEEPHVAERVPANLLLVVDRSGSMNCNLPPLQSSGECETRPAPTDATKESKWVATKTALNGALDSLLDQGDMRVGVSMFPRDSGAKKCHVESLPNVAIEDLTPAYKASISAFFETVTLKGNTPLSGATILGYDHLHDAFDRDGRKFLVLITDGFETCAQDTDYPTRLKTEFVPGALSVGIETFVIGVPGSEGGREDLSVIAYEGGTASSDTCDDSTSDGEVCHFDLTDSQTDLTADLEAALAEIRDSLVGCELELPTPSDTSVDASKVVVRVNGKNVSEDNSAPCEGGAEGWQYNAAKDGIILCGTPCDEANASSAEVIIALGCPPPT